MNCFYSLVILAFLSVMGSAHGGDRIKIEGRGLVDYEFLSEQYSQEGEDIDAFARRISPLLVQYSDQTHFEACGVIATDGQRYGVVIGSNRSHVACANLGRKVPEGMFPTGQTIHSHGTGAAYFNTNDLVFLGIPTTSRSRHMNRQTRGQDRSRFSEQDRKAGAGYLAHPSGLLHYENGVTRSID